MDPKDGFFLETLHDVEKKLSTERGTYGLVKMSGLLRQLLLDSLIDDVNRSRKCRIRYRAIDVHDVPFTAVILAGNPTIYSFQDALDPQTSMNEHLARDFTKEQFLQLVVAVADGEEVTVYETIVHAAHRLGGVHFDGIEKETHPGLKVMSKSTISVGGFSPQVRQLESIARVVLRSLDELRRCVEKDIGRR